MGLSTNAHSMPPQELDVPGGGTFPLNQAQLFELWTSIKDVSPESDITEH
jgi:hypothetical protein